jgi:hypothetical protein
MSGVRLPVAVRASARLDDAVTDRLKCDECGCVSRGRAEGWAAFIGEDRARVEPTSLGVFCPRCAGDFFDYRADEARHYT